MTEITNQLIVDGLHQSSRRAIDVYLELGFSLIPVRNKKPLISWEVFTTRKATITEVQQWQDTFGASDVGVVCGAVSGLFVLDVDGADVKDLLPFDIPMTWQVTTPRGGRHYYFQYNPVLDTFPTTKVGVLPKVDIRGRGGFCVLPSEQNAYKWVVSPRDTPLAPIPDWLMKLINKPKEDEAGNRPGWIAEALNNLDVGKRHGAFAKIIGRFNRDGFAPDDIYTLLAPHADGCGLGRAELLDQVKDMCKRYADQAAKPLTGLTAKQLLSSAKLKIPWLVEGLFPKEGVGILAGHPKIGKSWLTLDLAITVSQGGLWLSKFPVVPGHVLYVDEESSQDMLSSRFLKLLNCRGLTDAKIQFHSKEGFNFSVQQKIDELRSVMNLVQPRLVIFDSLNRVHRAEENSASQMGEVFRRVSTLSKEFGCFILFTDHLPHGQERFRGSSDKAAFVDAGFLATAVGNHNILVEHKYARHEQVKSFELALLDDGPEKTYVRWVG